MVRALGFLAFFALLVVAAPSHGQAHAWSRHFGSGWEDAGHDVAVSNDGRVAVTGVFGDTIDFGGGPLTAVGFYQDIYVAIYDAAGAHLWSRSFGNTSSERGEALALTSNDDVVVTGSFEGTLDFGGGDLMADGSDVFLLKLDAQGQHVWSRRFGGPERQSGRSVAVCPNGDILLAGTFQQEIDLGGGVLVSAGGYDVFLARLDDQGQHLWSRRFGGTADDFCGGVACDAGGSAVITGDFRNTIDLGGGVVASAGGRDGFLARYDTSGDHEWSRVFGGSGINSEDRGGDVVVDGDNHIVLTGNIDGSADLGGGPLTAPTGLSDFLLAKFTADGSHLWSRNAGGDQSESGLGVAVDPSNAILVTGRFNGTVDFGSGLFTSQGADDIFVSEYDAAGAHVWSLAFGSGPYSDRGNAIAADGAGNVVVTGTFSTTIDFGGGVFTGAGSLDAFLARYSTVSTSVPASVPALIVLEQNHPNPFNPATEIAFTVETERKIRLAVYDVRGTLVRTFLDRHVTAGSYVQAWDGTDAFGRPVASGTYFYRLTSEAGSQTRKAVLIR